MCRDPEDLVGGDVGELGVSRCEGCESHVKEITGELDW